MARLREHKAFSEIEGDIRYYYEDGTADALVTALNVAGRALSVAIVASEPVNAERLQAAKQTVFDLILERQAEFVGCAPDVHRLGGALMDPNYRLRFHDLAPGDSFRFVYNLYTKPRIGEDIMIKTSKAGWYRRHGSAQTYRTGGQVPVVRLGEL